MATKIFVNLPVKDLQKSIGFFTTLGFTLIRSSSMPRLRVWWCQRTFS